MSRIELKKGKKTGYIELKAKTESTSELVIYGDISSEKWSSTDIAPLEIRELIDTLKGEELEIYINSPGGDVFAGLAIYNLLKRYSGKKTVYIDGLAGSISSVIAMIGDKIVMPKNSFLMIHRSWGYFAGNVDELKKDIEVLEKTDTTMLDIYQEKMLESVSRETMFELMKNETWLNGEEASKYFDVEVVEETQTIMAHIDNNYKNIPKELMDRESNNQEKTRLKARLKLKLGVM